MQSPTCYSSSFSEGFPELHPHNAPSSAPTTCIYCPGEKAEKSLQFYASNGQKHDEEHDPNALKDTVGGPDFSAPCWSTIRDGGKDDVEGSEDAEDNQLQSSQQNLMR